VISGGGNLLAQTLYTPDIEKSKLWIEGSSNVNKFECQARTPRGFASVQEGPEITLRDAESENIEIKLTIEVRSFNCGQSRMNRDLNTALQSDRHPEIIFDYERSNILSTNPGTPESYKLEVFGSLTVAGVTKEIRIEAEGIIESENKLRVKGNKVIKMTDFSVEPPVAMLGLVRANDELNVHFDLHVIRQNEPNATIRNR
jgi:polyisoprenoid-binding protein YceI